MYAMGTMLYSLKCGWRKRGVKAKLVSGKEAFRNVSESISHAYDFK